LTTVLIILFALILFWFVFINKKNKSKSGIKHGQYHCVTILAGEQACKAVEQLKNKRILSAEAPSLPLPGCDVEQCQCRFNHHEERRIGERRGAYNKAIEEITGATVELKPRQKKDRRQ